MRNRHQSAFKTLWRAPGFRYARWLLELGLLLWATYASTVWALGSLGTLVGACLLFTEALMALAILLTMTVHQHRSVDLALAGGGLVGASISLLGWSVAGLNGWGLGIMATVTFVGMLVMAIPLFSVLYAIGILPNLDREGRVPAESWQRFFWRLSPASFVDGVDLDAKGTPHRSGA